MKTTCQILIIIWLAAFFLRNIWTDFHGAPEREPHGFLGSVASILAVATFAVVLWRAGAFSGL